MASYKIIFEKRAEKELRKLAAPVRQRISDAIDTLEHSPRPAASRQMIGVSGYRLRVGDYRIIYTVNERIVTVIVIRIGHRREIYKR